MGSDGDTETSTLTLHGIVLHSQRANSTVAPREEGYAQQPSSLPSSIPSTICSCDQHNVRVARYSSLRTVT
jgi:hypothetical protein